jgi:hypothetical protein
MLFDAQLLISILCRCRQGICNLNTQLNETECLAAGSCSARSTCPLCTPEECPNYGTCDDEDAINAIMFSVGSDGGVCLTPFDDVENYDCLTRGTYLFPGCASTVYLNKDDCLGAGMNYTWMTYASTEAECKAHGQACYDSVKKRFKPTPYDQCVLCDNHEWRYIYKWNQVRISTYFFQL